MGMWSSPFSSKTNALKLQELMSKPWSITLVDGEKELVGAYEVVGSDELFDFLQEYDVGHDCRYCVRLFLKKWIENIESFNHVDKEALHIVKQIIKESF